MSRKLDALVAERVEGWDCAHLRAPYVNKGSSTLRRCDKCGQFGNTSFPLAQPPAYSTDMNAALGALETLVNDGWSYGMWGASRYSSVQRGALVALRKGVFPPPYGDRITPENGVVAEAPTLPLALCIALLRAVGVDEAEITAALERT